MTSKKLTIFAVSDATGELAVAAATAALRQFRQEGVNVLRRARIRNPERITKVIREAKEAHGLIIFTLVSQELREILKKQAHERKVPAVDVMGPMMESMANYLKTSPSDQPGLKYQITHDYFRRNEAIEFAVKHDDGQGRETMDQADVVLLGISRTSKTPLSIYLATRGYKSANVPIIKGMELPLEVRSLSRKKLVGLSVDAEQLSELRGTRLAKLGLSKTESYAQIESIQEELDFSQKIYQQLGGIPVIDVTSKAIEEVATEVLSAVGL